MLAGAERLNRLRRVQEHGCAHIHDVDGGIRESFLKVRPRAHAEGNRFGGIAGDEAIQAAARLGLDRGDDTASGDVADSDDDPVEHIGSSPFPRCGSIKTRAAYIGLRMAGVTPAGPPPRRRRYKCAQQKQRPD